MSKTFINFLPILTLLPSGVLWTSDSCGSVLPFFCWAVPSGMRTELGVLGLISKVPYARLTLLSVGPWNCLGPAVASSAGIMQVLDKGCREMDRS